MIHRRRFLLAAIPASAYLALQCPSVALAVEVGDLKEQLRLKLRPRTPAEANYLNRVVLLVQQGFLPRSLVLKMFQWARKKEPYPFPYFHRALTIEARKLGIAI